MEEAGPIDVFTGEFMSAMQPVLDWLVATFTGVQQGEQTGGGLSGILLIFVFLLLAVGAVYFVGVEILRRNRMSIPILSRSPLGYPKNTDYLAETSGMLKPEEFHYEWPEVVIAGTRYNLSRAERDPRNKLKFQLDTGTVVEFVPKK
jgi:hypothetical protein